jgi:hypothetical protein
VRCRNLVRNKTVTGIEIGPFNIQPSFGKIEQLREATFYLLLALQRSIAQNVPHFDPPFAQPRRHQNATMAIQRVFFSADHGNLHFSRTFDNSINAANERWFSRDQPVVRSTVYLTFRL